MESKYETVMEACDAGCYDKGFDGFAYRADTYCWNCIMSYLKEHPEIANVDASDWRFWDSDASPQPIFFGESDRCMHCATCGKYLYGHCEDAEREECLCLHCDPVWQANQK